MENLENVLLFPTLTIPVLPAVRQFEWFLKELDNQAPDLVFLLTQMLVIILMSCLLEQQFVDLSSLFCCMHPLFVNVM